MKGKSLLKTSTERQDRMDRLLIGHEGEGSWGGEVKNQWSDVNMEALLPTPLGKLKNPRAIGEQGVLRMNKNFGESSTQGLVSCPSRK